MCPRCKRSEVIQLWRREGRLEGTEFRAASPGEMTAIICVNCGMVIYELDRGWTSDIVEKGRMYAKLARAQGINSDNAISDFLSELGIPLSCQKGGAYYYDTPEIPEG